MPQSYRPISLLNADYNHFSTVLTSRLNHMMNSYVYPGQAWFMNGRYLKYNIRRDLNVINYRHTMQSPALLQFIDAKKAFDRVEWIFSLKKYWPIQVLAQFSILDKNIHRSVSRYFTRWMQVKANFSSALGTAIVSAVTYTI